MLFFQSTLLNILLCTSFFGFPPTVDARPTLIARGQVKAKLYLVQTIAGGILPKASISDIKSKGVNSHSTWSLCFVYEGHEGYGPGKSGETLARIGGEVVEEEEEDKKLLCAGESNGALVAELEGSQSEIEKFYAKVKNHFELETSEPGQISSLRSGMEFVTVQAKAKTNGNARVQMEMHGKETVWEIYQNAISKASQPRVSQESDWMHTVMGAPGY